MKRIALSGLACALAFAVVGCGPLASPMPARLDPDTQNQIDAGWDRAFITPGHLERQELLDVMVGTQAYQLGVDTFNLRATKKIAGGHVVMEITFDRTKPDEDRFEVTVYDDAGKMQRQERYGRNDVEATYEALFVNSPPPGDAASAAKRAEYDARWNKIRSLFPETLRIAPMPRQKN